MELVNELNIGKLIPPIISIALAVILGILIRIKVKLKNQTFHEEIIRKVKVRIFLHECKKNINFFILFHVFYSFISHNQYFLY